MYYKDYIKLGFRRTDINDSVEFDQTGYPGYILTKQLAKGVFIELCAGELNNPKLYIKKNPDGDCKVLPLTIEQLRYLCK